MILIQQLPYMMEDIKDDMTNGKSGSADTLFVKTQTGLFSPISSTEIALQDKTFTNSSISVSHVIPIETANSVTLKEHEINNGTDSYNRSVKADIIKTNQKEVTIIHTFDFEVV